MSRMHHARAVVLGCALLVGGAAAASAQEPEPTAARAAIDSVNRRFEAAFAAQDAAGIAQLYATGGQILPPGSTALSGEPLQQFWAGAFGAGLTKVELGTTSLEVIGDLAIETGTATLYAGEQVADTANYLVVWKRENGAWRLYRDIWNSQQPATPAP